VIGGGLGRRGRGVKGMLRIVLLIVMIARARVAVMIGWIYPKRKESLRVRNRQVGIGEQMMGLWGGLWGMTDSRRRIVG
jgi:hypothetical protein